MASAEGKDTGAVTQRGASAAAGLGIATGPGSASAVPTLPIMVDDRIDIDRMYDEGGTRRQAIKGFDAEYSDIVDYIVRCTHRIWEEAGVGLIYTHYNHNTPVWTANGLMVGREPMVQNTLRTLSAYPGRKIYVHDVVWSGNEIDGFHTSMRAISYGRNTGWSAYGPPTGRMVQRMGIANCFVKENMIVEEWLAHDEIQVVRMLGFDPFEVARKQAIADLNRGAPQPAPKREERGLGQRMPTRYPEAAPGAGFDIEDYVRRMLHEIWNWRMINRVRDYCAPNFKCHTTRGRELFGQADYIAYVLELLAAFPDMQLDVDHIYWNGNDRDGYRTAVRWVFSATHDGPGFWGAPTGKPVRMLGITQHFIKDGKVHDEWTVFDEMALLKQIAVI